LTDEAKNDEADLVVLIPASTFSCWKSGAEASGTATGDD
jgi:hypothetical protein